jgi:hypothetical protein
MHKIYEHSQKIPVTSDATNASDTFDTNDINDIKTASHNFLQKTRYKRYK